MKILIATSNEGKLSEVQNALAGVNCETVGLRGFDIESFEETGATFRANSLLKAQYYHAQTGLPTIADDSGLSVDYLGGEPGVKSRRWPGYEASDAELLDMLLSKLRGVPMEQRSAQFICAISFIYDARNRYTTDHATKGVILEKPILPLKNGIPWSSLFLASEVGKVYAQLTPEEKNKVSHRGKAVEKIKPFIIKHLSHA